MEPQLGHSLVPKTIYVTSSSHSFFTYKMEIVIVTAIQGPAEEEMINLCAGLRKAPATERVRSWHYYCYYLVI